MEEIIYQDVINKLVADVLCEQYTAGAQFIIDRASLMSIAISSDLQIDQYLQTAVASGVSVESAAICISLFLKLKLSENAS